MTADKLQEVLTQIYGPTGWPKPFHLLPALTAANAGEPVNIVAKSVGTSAKNLQRSIESPDIVQALLGNVTQDYSPKALKVRATIGQLIIGNLAERVFEETYRATVGITDLRLEDDRSSGGDTDYLVRNGQERQVFRLNIKFHGSQVQESARASGLQPEDCFALATYHTQRGAAKAGKRTLTLHLRRGRCTKPHRRSCW